MIMEKQRYSGLGRNFFRQSLKPLSELSPTMESGALFHKFTTEGLVMDGVRRYERRREEDYS